ncbi:TfoX/Sxy family DNA transformation protein [Methyloglobulus sp.]|uniref:TfoX/Sxy family DNA transformation protein n=1 Tax=Methyloglobulus sp. TaxID=2518622 RepID=UPI00398A09F1
MTAYVQAKRSGASASLNLLWALEAALTGLGKMWPVTIVPPYYWPWKNTKTGVDSISPFKLNKKE